MRSKPYNSRISGMYRRNVSASAAIALEIFSSLSCDLGNKAFLHLVGGDHKALLDLEINPLDYRYAEDFRDDYLCCSLLSKYPYLNTGVDTRAVALQKFNESELQCSTSNKRIGSFVSSIKSLYTVESAIWQARLKIASLLGPFSWDLAEPHFSFGPGSTTSASRRFGDAYFKFGAVKPHVTKACSELAMLAIARIPRWYDHLCGLSGKLPEDIRLLSLDCQVEALLTVVPGNRVTTVPKNAKSDRTIAIEPDLNMYIQKGIGSLIRSKLARVGIDLNDQTRNQSLACEGSMTGSLATIDLSSASDTVSMRLVELLLPEDWVSAIKLSRSPRGVLPDGTVITYQKVSSMGNGFTFELESLIFWAICKVVLSWLNPREDRLAVYGDDIIISSEVYGTVVWLLNYFGFTVNERKSFSTGPFRESCGKHFFNGVDVTPFYIREDIKSPDRLIWAANMIRRWARHPVWGLDGRLHKAYLAAVNRLPVSLQKPSIPDGLGDIALIGDFDEVRPPRSKHLFCWVAVGVGDLRPTFVPGEIPYLLRSLQLLERSKMGTGTSVGVSNALKRKWVLVKVPVTQWISYGAWLAP